MTRQLTPLAQQAIELRRQGKCYKQISRELDVSYHRVVGAIRKGLKLGLVERRHTRHRYIGTSIATGETMYFDGGSALEAEGFSRGCVWSAARGQQKTHGGFTWELANAHTN